MNQNERQTIEQNIKEGKTRDAQEKLNTILRSAPDDWDAKLLLGTCAMLNGDFDTARKLHEECNKHFNSRKSSEFPEKQYSFWKKYHKWIIAGGIAAALTVGGAVYVDKNVKEAELELMRSGEVRQLVPEDFKGVCYYSVSVNFSDIYIKEYKDASPDLIDK